MAHGFAAARMEPIARDAGVSTATLYAFFPGKSELFQAVIDEASEDFARRVAHVRTVEGPARCQLERFAETYLEFMADPLVRAVFRLVITERPRFETSAIHFVDRGKFRIATILVETLRTLTANGELRCEKPSWAAGQLLGMLEHPGFFVPLVSEDHIMLRRDRVQIARDAVETFLARYGTP